MDSVVSQILVASTPPTPPAKKFSSPKIIIVAIVVLLILALSATLVFAGQSFFPDSVSLALYKIPFLPKTPRQILLASTKNSSNLTTFKSDFSLSASVGGGSLDAASLDLSLKGPLDFANPQNPQFSVAIDGLINFTGNKYSSTANLVGQNHKHYLKVNSLSDSIISLINPDHTLSPEIKQNLDKVFTNWISYDTNGLETEARKNLQSNSQNQSLIDSSRRKILSLLVEKTIVDEVKLIGTETINNTPTYHLRLSPSKQSLKHFLTSLYPNDKANDPNTLKVVDDMTQNIDSFTLDSWFAVSDANPRKLSLNLQLNLGSLFQLYSGSHGSSLNSIPSLGNLSATHLNISSVLNINDIGVKQTITTPPISLAYQDYLTLLIANAYKTTAQIAADAQKVQVDHVLTDKANSILKTFIDTGVYPANVSIPAGYTYKIFNSGKGFALYLQFTPNNPYPYAHETTTPYYGISSSSSYPHQLNQNDFK